MGYDVSFGYVKPRNGKAQMPLPWCVRLELDVVVGSELVMCSKATPGILDVAEVSALDERDVDGKLILGELVVKCPVRRDGGSVVITIPKEAKVVLGNVVLRYLDFGLTDCPGVCTLKIFETPGVAETKVETLTKCLRKWPVPVLDAAAAWRVGFEPFMQAMEVVRITPRYPERGLLNMPRVAAVNEIMMETADLQAELRRREQWSSMS